MQNFIWIAKRFPKRNSKWISAKFSKWISAEKVKQFFMKLSKQILKKSNRFLKNISTEFSKWIFYIFGLAQMAPLLGPKGPNVATKGSS